MRIATSTIYAQQTAAIDDQVAQYATLGQQLSSGKSLNAPSDDPAHVAQDLQVRAAINDTTQQGTNVQNAISQLTTTDSALGSLVNVIQSARQLGIQGATETLTDDQRAALANQIDEVLQESIAVGNTKYGNTYIFSGTSATANPPVQQLGNPIQGVQFIGNEQVQGQLIYNGQQFALSTTFQAAFNYQATDGSPDVFQTLINLRNTLTNKTAVALSSTQVNQPGTLIYGPKLTPGSPTPTTIGGTGFATTPVPDSTGNYTIELHSTVNGVDVIQNVTVAPTDAVDDGTATSLVGRINALTPTTGITAAFNAKTQRLSLTGTGTFYVTDVPSPGATNAANLTKVFNLPMQGDFVQNVSTQLGDIDHVLNTVLNARSVVGARIQALTAISSQLQSTVTDNKKIESGIEDVDIASATSKFSQTQTALQAAYATTTRLESKTLFDYLS